MLCAMQHAQMLPSGSTVNRHEAGRVNATKELKLFYNNNQYETVFPIGSNTTNLPSD